MFIRSRPDESASRSEHFSDWPEPPLYSGSPRGEHVMVFGLTHSFYHRGEIRTAQSCLASPHSLSPA